MKGLLRAFLICLALCTDLGASKTNQLQVKHIPSQDHKPLKQVETYVDKSC